MFHAIDDFLIDKVFQPTGDWICNRIGCGVYRQAYTMIIVNIVVVLAYTLADAFILRWSDELQLMIFGFTGSLVYVFYRPRYKRDADQEDDTDIWARTALKGYRVTKFFSRMISLNIMVVYAVSTPLEFVILSYSITLKWTLSLGTLMIAEYLHACRSHPPRQTRKQTKHLFAGAAQTI